MSNCSTCQESCRKRDEWVLRKIKTWEDGNTYGSPTEPINAVPFFRSLMTILSDAIV
jgi:hypothetical protein